MSSKLSCQNDRKSNEISLIRPVAEQDDHTVFPHSLPGVLHSRVLVWQKETFIFSFSLSSAIRHEHPSNGTMHLETTTKASDYDEQGSTCFSDLYNLYEIIGKYERSARFRSFVHSLVDVSAGVHSVSFVGVRTKPAANSTP